MTMTSFDLNLLLVLDTVLRERSVARAAQRLHVTPSAVSNSLAKLRTQLGDPLVTRKGRGIIPTPRALELQPALARALGDIEHAVNLEAFEPSRCTRTFTLAMADALQLVWLPQLAAALGGKLPSARLRVVGIDSLLSLGNLSSGEVDLHVGVRASGPGVRAEPLYDETMVLVARRAHPLCAGRLSQRRLGTLRHVAVELAPGRGFRDPIAAAYARSGVEREVSVTVSTFAAAASVVARSELVTTLPASLLATLGKALGLIAVKGTVPKQRIALALCWHERTHQDPASSSFRALVRAVLTGAPDSPLRASR
jgi:DNA-binding transcriptional LysR family regulator